MKIFLLHILHMLLSFLLMSAIYWTFYEYFHFISLVSMFFFVPDWLFRGLGTKINKSINPTKRNPNLGWCIGWAEKVVLF